MLGGDGFDPRSGAGEGNRSSPIFGVGIAAAVDFVAGGTDYGRPAKPDLSIFQSDTQVLRGVQATLICREAVFLAVSCASR